MFGSGLRSGSALSSTPSAQPTGASDCASASNGTTTLRASAANQNFMMACDQSSHDLQASEPGSSTIWYYGGMRMQTIAIGMCTVVFATVGIVAVAQQKPVSSRTPIVVYKTPTCGCCALWVEHMRQNGFQP